MLRNLLAGMPVILLCLLLQAIFVGKGLRYYARFRQRKQGHESQWLDMLGYGDIVMSERWRLLGPLEAANGILMFGVSTAVMTAAVMDVIKDNAARLRPDD